MSYPKGEWFKDSFGHSWRYWTGLIMLSVYWDASVRQGTPTGYKISTSSGYISDKFYPDVQQAKKVALEWLENKLKSSLRMVRQTINNSEDGK